jgi:uncharacterized protein
MKFALTGVVLIASTLIPTSELLAAGALPSGPYVIATGTATSDIAPDYAVFIFSVNGLAQTTSDASTLVDQKTAKILAVLKEDGIADDDIRASNLNVSPSYDYDGNKRIYRGQNVIRDFRVTLHDLKKFSSLVQGLIDANTDEISDVDFGSSKETEIKKQNLEAAIDDARKQANYMAARAGEHVVRIYGMAPGEYSSFIRQDFPMEGYASQLGNIEVTGSRIKRTEAYIVPKSIRFSSTVTIVCMVK